MHDRSYLPTSHKSTTILYHNLVKFFETLVTLWSLECKTSFFIFHKTLLNPFLTNAQLLNPLKTSENFQHRSGAMVKNGLNNPICFLNIKEKFKFKIRSEILKRRTSLFCFPSISLNIPFAVPGVLEEHCSVAKKL